MVWRGATHTQTDTLAQIRLHYTVTWITEPVLNPLIFLKICVNNKPKNRASSSNVKLLNWTSEWIASHLTKQKKCFVKCFEQCGADITEVEIMCINFNWIVSPLFVTGLGNLKAQVTPECLFPLAHLNVLLQACTSWSQQGLWWWWWVSWDAAEPSKSLLACWDWWVISFVF